MKRALLSALAAGLWLCLAQGPAAAQTATPDIAEKLQLCTGCHGEGGLPVNPDMPIIWGQNYYYLYVQLKDYAAGRRQNEVMTPIAAELSKEEQQALAKHFSEQPWPKTGFPPVEPAVSQQAQRAMTAGACTECHLANLRGRSSIPRVSGQQPAYLEKTMLELKNKVRQNAPAKASLFATFPDEDLKALAAYLATR
ncbi:MAG TPA: cytochrome c4 [Alphaproteobacteria bacterium]